MFSYRHAFHAGNHADVLKHLCLFLCLRHFNRKDKPYRYIDTHAGAGLYRTDDKCALKTGEFHDGIARLETADNLCAPLADFVQHLHNKLPEGYYWGSPSLVASLLRANDQMFLFEKHSSDFPLLQENMKMFRRNHQNCHIRQSDGFAAPNALLPPPTRRALVLTDPSYETPDDYTRVTGCLKNALKRFATGCYMIWYPCLSKAESFRLPEELKKIAQRYLHAALRVADVGTDGFGMVGSGMFVVNPPFTLADELSAALPQLTQLLAQTNTAAYELNVCAP